MALLLLAACAPGAPAPIDSGSPSPTAATTIDPSVSPDSSAAETLDQDVAAALGDPSLARLAGVGEALDIAIEANIGLDTALSADVRRWLMELRSTVTAAALEAAGIDSGAETAAVGRPIAARGLVPLADTATGGLTWVGAVTGTPLALQSGMNRIGETFTSNLDPQTSTDTTRAGDLETVATTTSQLSLSVNGSTVVAQADVTQSSTTTNVTNGQVVVNSTYHTAVRAELNACPDSNGQVTLTLTIDMSATTSGAAGSSSYDMQATSEVQATVGEDAFLASETTTQDADYTVTPAGGPAQVGSGQRTIAATYGAGGTGATVTSATETLGNGTMAQAESSRWQNAVQLTSTLASSNALSKAQSLWRAGKCVTIEASEGSRMVSAREQITFTAQPKHAIEGNLLDKPIEAQFSGIASLTPIGTRQMPLASFDFVAGPRAGDRGTASLKSTSNRGIGMLDITFEVAPGWTIDSPTIGGRITGTKCGGIDGDWEAIGDYHHALGGPMTDGDQEWSITVDESTMTAAYHYQVVQTMKVAGITVYVTGGAVGTATVTLDDQGRVIMHLTERDRAYVSWTSVGGEGSSVPWTPPEPLSDGDLVWDPGADC